MKTKTATTREKAAIKVTISSAKGCGSTTLMMAMAHLLIQAGFNVECWAKARDSKPSRVYPNTHMPAKVDDRLIRITEKLEN